jgi:hypothetical protein
METVPFGRRIAELRQWGFLEGWTVERFDPSHALIRFTKMTHCHGEVILDVWYSTMTVGTTLTHPIQGRNTLFRKRVNNSLMIALFRNPRLHTHGKGYRRRV